MSLTIGSRLGPYEVIAKLGEGGMGEVYRARDGRLGRDVAIKVLPAQFVADDERLARFEREARLLAALNHPNIATIHGIEESGSSRALVMELVEGETLAQRVERGAMPLDEALPIFVQIAAALEYAHEQAIVHRDLKPANVKLTPEGKVKVLDFGLAKALDPAAGARSPSAAHSPTMTAAATQLGLILGTAAYMAPEQARGKSVDRRADVWAFGVMLHEALTGRLLFSGESVSETIAEVLKTAPDMTSLPPDTPPRVRRLLERCLRKDPQARLQAIGDARIVLEEALRGEGEEPAPAAGNVMPSRRAVGLLEIGLLTAVLAAGVGVGWLLHRPAAVAAPEMRMALALPDELPVSGDEYPQVAVSRDGRQQVVVVEGEATIGRPQLLYRRIDEIEPRLLADTDGARAPFFSPDGAWIGFFRRTELLKVPVTGGPPVRLAEIGLQTRGACWSRDGYIYLAPDTAVALSRVRETGGPLEPVTQLDVARGERTHRWPDALPDGSAVVFTSDTETSTEYYDDARIEAVRPSTGERKVLIEGSSQARVLASGHLVFARGGSLFAVPLDLQTLEVRGVPAEVAHGVATMVSTGAVHYAVSDSGAALWVPGGTGTGLWLPVWFDREGRETPTTIAAGSYSEIALSPDGTMVALVGGEGGNADLWVADLERGSLTRLTFGEFVSSPTWTPDGTRIAYGLRLKGQTGYGWSVAWKPADGSRDSEVLVQGERIHSPSSFSPDGRFLLYDRVNTDATKRDIWIVATASPREPRVLLEGPFTHARGVISPDGRFLAYVSNEGGRESVYVRPFPSGEGRWQISAPYGAEPRFSPDGREIFYRDGSALYRVAVDGRQGFSAGRPERLFAYGASDVYPDTYTPAPDGRSFLATSIPRDAKPPRQVVFDLSFAASVKRLTAPPR